MVVVVVVAVNTNYEIVADIYRIICCTHVFWLGSIDTCINNNNNNNARESLRSSLFLSLACLLFGLPLLVKEVVRGSRERDIYLEINRSIDPPLQRSSVCGNETRRVNFTSSFGMCVETTPVSDVVASPRLSVFWTYVPGSSAGVS